MKWKSVAELQKQIDAYFASCFEPDMREVKRESGDHKWIERKDWRGETIVKQIVPLTVTGLAMYLGTSRETLVNYEKRDEFFDAIKAAKLRIENYNEIELFRDKNVTGVIFNLKNNYGWKDRSELTGAEGTPLVIAISEHVATKHGTDADPS